MPEEVFELWLDAAIVKHGWPPKGAEWARLFRKRPISFWRTLEWRVEQVDLGATPLAADSRYPALGIARAAFEGASNAYAPLAKANAGRLKELVREARASRSLPGKLVCLKTPKGTLDVADGIIRLAAILFAHRRAEKPFRSKIRAWVGELPK